MNNQLVPAQPIELTDPKGNANRIFDLIDATETTRTDYKERIGLFLDFIKNNQINRNSFLEFKRYLADKSDMAVSSKNKYLTSARVFLRELGKQGLLPVDITANVKGFTQDKKHKKSGVNDEEVTLLVEKLRLLSPTPDNIRIKAMFGLLMFQGLRQVEIFRLNVEDVDLVNKKAFVLGKGRDDKSPIDLHPATIELLADYIKTNKVKSGALFVSHSNKTIGKRLSTRAIRFMVKEMLEQVGINDKSTHGFRHYFTTQLIKRFKGNVLEVAKFTRHKSLEMLQVYNDEVKTKEDLPDYYKAFSGLSF